jgi:hypothetical protein
MSQWSAIQDHRRYIDQMLIKMPLKEQNRARKELKELDKEIPWETRYE